MKAFYEDYRDISSKIFANEGLPYYFPAHWHEAFEAIWVERGVFTVGINDNIYHIKENDLMIINRNDIHYYSDETDGRSLVAIVHPDILKPYMPVEHKLISYISAEDLEKNGLDEKVPRIMRELVEINNKAEKLWYSTSAGLCIELFSYLYKYFTAEDIENTEGSEKNNNFKKLLLYLNDNIEREISLEDAAKYLNYSVWHFSRLFQEYTNRTFTSYMNELRINSSEKLLKDTDTPVSEIAMSCGFKSIRNFNREFKKYHNLTPTEYRHNSKGKSL